MKRKSHQIETDAIATASDPTIKKQAVFERPTEIQVRDVQSVLRRTKEGEISRTITMPCTRLDFWRQLAGSPAVRTIFTETIFNFAKEAFNSGYGNGVYLEFPNLMGRETDPASFQLISTHGFDDIALFTGPLPRGNAFSHYAKMADPKQPIISFPNVTQDTWLVVPNEVYFAGWETSCAHLASFVRAFAVSPAAAEAVHHLWVGVAKHVLAFHEVKHGQGEKLYVSTHGTGISWLQVRLSDSPKYYAGSTHMEGDIAVTNDPLEGAVTNEMLEGVD
jgi:hypothetical protein